MAVVTVMACSLFSVSPVWAFERSVSTGFGTLTYTIDGVEEAVEPLNSQGRTLVEQKNKTLKMEFREGNNFGKEEIQDIYHYWNTFNSYRIYQLSRDEAVKISITFTPNGSNSSKDTKYFTVGKRLKNVNSYVFFYCADEQQQPPSTITNTSVYLQQPPYKYETVENPYWSYKNGLWIRIGARYTNQHLDGKTYKEDIEMYYDEFFILPPRKNNASDSGNSRPVIPVETTDDIAPEHEEIETAASEEEGEVGWVIPGLIAAITLAGGLTAWRLRKKKREEDASTPPPVPVQEGGQSQMEEDPDERCVYEMRIKKNFGDTFTPGDAPQTVYARIVKITPEGYESTDSTLTQLIRITGDDYLEVSENTYMGDYMAANVFAPDMDGAPDEAVLHFTMSAEGASFTNHMHFFVEGAEILFGQDNLTLPTKYDKTVELPFVVSGLGENPKVELSVEKDAYKVEVRKDEKEGVWYAVLKENATCPEFKEELNAGQYRCYELHVSATSETGRKTETRFPICRFQMGLAIDIDIVKCYEEEYNESKHHGKRFVYQRVVDTTSYKAHEPKFEVKKMLPGETKCKLRLFEFDEETHQLLRIAPVPSDVKWEAEDSNKQSMVDKLGLIWEPLADVDDGARSVIFRCHKGALDAPLRINAKMTLTSKFEDKVYTVEKPVRLHSQPIRQSENMDHGMSLLKEDEHLTDYLVHVQNAIFSHGYLNNLAPLDRFIQVMLDGYDADFGYDNEQLRTVRRIWIGFLQGTYVGANGDTQPVTLGDEMILFFNAFMEKSKEVEDSLDFFSRMAVGIITLGCSEVVFTSLEVVRDMKAYVDNGGDSVWGGFWCGVKVVGREYLTEKIMDGGLGLIKKGAAKVGITKDNIKKKAKEMWGNITQGRRVKQAISDTKIAKTNAIAKVEHTKLLTDGKRLDLDDIKMKKAEMEGLELGRKKIEKFKEVMDLPDTPKNAELKKKMAMEIQKDKNAMSLLADYDNKALNETRRKFTMETQALSEGADYEVMYEMAAEKGIPFNEVKKLNASASSKAKLANGEKITFDHDATFYHENPKTGQITYFDQVETEKLYNKKYYKEYHGEHAVSTESNYSKFAKEADQTVIQSDLHPESYGTDNFKTLADKTKVTESLPDANMVGDAMTFKCNEWYEQGVKEMKNAATAPSGISKIREACRQCTKQYDNYLSPRNITRSGVNGGNKIPPEFHAYMRILKEMDVNKGGSVVKAKKQLEALGTNFEKVFQQLGDLMKEVG